MGDFSYRLLSDHWFGELGCAPSDLKRSKLTVSTHGTSLVAYPGIIFFRQDAGCAVSVPNKLKIEMEMRFSKVSVEEVFNPKFLSDIFGDDVEKLIGPAWIGSISRKDFLPCHGDETRLLLAEDWKAFDRFLSKNSQKDVEFSSLESGRSPTAAVFQEGEVVAAASYEILGDQVAHIGVLALSTFRGRGFATKAISQITELALTENLGIQYQTLVENISSVSAAKRLGFRKFAETISIRLKSLKA